MPRSRNQKKKLFILRSVLLERSDRQHPISMPELIKALEAHGISAERKSIYDDIETLIELGVDIKSAKGRNSGYYIDSREFELPELKLLVDAVSASKLIPEEKSASLIKKLSSLTSIHHRKSLNRAVFVSNRSKSGNEQIYDSIDKIHDAIENGVDITFKYFNWSIEKKKILRRNGERYYISPWSLVWDDSNYYLVGFDTQIKEMRHFRVDKMLHVDITETKRSGKEEFEAFDISSYSGAVFGMFGGKPERITLSCANRLANVMLDRFGSDTVILKESPERFRITVTVVRGPIFEGWLMSFGDEVKIIENSLKV